MAGTRTKSWTIPDLVDLEYYLAQDGDVDEAVLARRDRELYRTSLAQGNAASRRDLLRRWLDLRRELARSEHPVPQPGEVVADVLRLVPPLLFVIGALLGGGLAWGVLSYAGDQPINLFVALVLLVGVPCFTALLSVLLPAWRLVARGSISGIFNTWLVGALLTWLSRRSYGKGDNARGRLALAQGFGILRSRSGLYSGIIGWLVFRLMQSAALGFSLAVLIVVLLRGWIADLAFSWQTTTRVSVEQVHGFVAMLARPWAGLADPPYAHPTLEQVAGSRVFLKEGLQHLASADLQSWWYFLLWAILVYTVLPRLILVGAGLLGSRCALGRMAFREARCEALCRRMQHPLVKVDTTDEGPPDDFPENVVLPGGIRDGITRVRVLVPQDLLGDEATEQWQQELQREFNAAVEGIVAVTLDLDEDADLLETLTAGADQVALVLVLEGWQPCITATLEYLKGLRRLLGKDPLLIVALVGRQDHSGGRAPTPDHEFGIWRGRLASLGDPMLLVHNWRTVHE